MIFQGLESFPINGSYFGGIVTHPELGMRLIPYCRLAVSIRDVGPVVVTTGSEDESEVVYRLHDFTGGAYEKYFIKVPVNWVLLGSTVHREKREILIETSRPESGFGLENRSKTNLYATRPDDIEYQAKKTLIDGIEYIVWQEA